MHLGPPLPLLQAVVSSLIAKQVQRQIFYHNACKKKQYQTKIYHPTQAQLKPELFIIMGAIRY